MASHADGGDKARCLDCDMPGRIIVDEGGYYIKTHVEEADEGCTCQWCLEEDQL